MQWFLLLLQVTTIIGYKILSNSQWSNINNILRITKDEHIQIKTRNVIYEYYESWAIQQSHVFKQYHSYLCRDIRGDDLVMYGCIGLKKATVNYDPTKCGLFTKYADFYVKGELYKGVRKIKPILLCSNNMGDIQPPLIYNKKNGHDEGIELFTEKWGFLKEDLTDFEYRCVIYKYSFEFVKEMSNARVAELMVCSEETVRKALLKANNIIYSSFFI